MKSDTKNINWLHSPTVQNKAVEGMNLHTNSVIMCAVLNTDKNYM